jgi:hypothetical protein
LCSTQGLLNLSLASYPSHSPARNADYLANSINNIAPRVRDYLSFIDYDLSVRARVQIIWWVDTTLTYINSTANLWLSVGRARPLDWSIYCTCSIYYSDRGLAIDHVKRHTAALETKVIFYIPTSFVYLWSGKEYLHVMYFYGRLIISGHNFNND